MRPIQIARSCGCTTYSDGGEERCPDHAFETTWAILRRGDIIAGGFKVISVEPAGNGWVSVLYRRPNGSRECVDRLAAQSVSVAVKAPATKEARNLRPGDVVQDVATNGCALTVRSTSILMDGECAIRWEHGYGQTVVLAGRFVVVLT